MASRDLDENPYVAPHVQQWAPARRPSNALQGLQMMLKGQHPSLSLLQVERILDRLIGIGDIVRVQTGVGID
jgi:hypothetical protein